VGEGYGAAVAERLYLFVQFEFPWELGPPDGRYLLRSRLDGEPERVLVLETLGAQRRAGALARARARAGASGEAENEPTPVPVARASVVDPVPVAAERQAQAWLNGMDHEREVAGAAAALNRMLYFHRIASADPYAREVSPWQALAIRAGWAEGEQIAGGSWRFARELAPSRPRGSSRRRWPGGRAQAAALRSAERLAALLAARAAPLQCEELALRARLDLDEGRLRHAATQLERAFAAALPELRGEGREDLAIRIAELEKLRSGVAAQALAARPESEQDPQEEVVRHALERLEAALRARAAYGPTG